LLCADGEHHVLAQATATATFGAGAAARRPPRTTSFVTAPKRIAFSSKAGTKPAAPWQIHNKRQKQGTGQQVKLERFFG
jgi:hypothetical protein